MMRFLTLTAIAALAAVALPALAQDAAPTPTPDAAPGTDWTILRQRQNKSLIAYIPVTTGLMLAVRCVDGALDGLITGLPAVPASQQTRPLGLAFGDEPLHTVRWSVTTDPTAAISDYPARFARSLKRGGSLKIFIPGGAPDGRNLRHDLTLPASSSAIEQTLAACNRPLEDPRDALLPDIEENGLPMGLTWARAPRFNYPSTNYARGYVVTSCIARADGALEQCQIESLQPPKSRFGAAVLRGLSDARVEVPSTAEGTILPRLVAFRTNFYMQGHQPRRGEQ